MCTVVRDKIGSSSGSKLRLVKRNDRELSSTFMNFPFNALSKNIFLVSPQSMFTPIDWLR